jgi:pimeloyl-ACP methyl ester carboxylesterase
MRRCLVPLVVVSLLAGARGAVAVEFEAIPRVLPPVGLEIPEEVRERLQSRLAETKRRLEAIADEARPDVEIFTKAVEFALAHREFYVERDFAKADWALDQANQRLDALAKGESPWTKATGLVVRGYRSSIDDSVQPYGLVIPKDHDFPNRTPLYIWLHGRGDKNTDLHFLQERATRPGQITPPGAVVVHPFGRHCVGWKHAGEIDVLEVVADVQRHYLIDPSRIVLIGFSMGGAGAWHIGAHYTDKWVAVCPGAGFAETAHYQRLTPDRFPPSYEQTLWGLYDVPGYVRNLFNTETVAYSGELDRQIQAARVMEEAFQQEGRTLTHLIGPGVEHKYEPETLKELLRRVDAVVAKGQDKSPDEVQLQTRTLRYPSYRWLTITGLKMHWSDARVDAKRLSEDSFELTTKNVTGVQIDAGQMERVQLKIDGQTLFVRRRLRKDSGIRVRHDGSSWVEEPPFYAPQDVTLRKLPGLQGPIDDAFMLPFVVVTPTGKSKNAAFQAWVDFELQHFRDRWRALMRAELPEIADVDFEPGSPKDQKNLVFFGDADSNVALQRLASDFTLPVKFNGANWSLGDQWFDGNRFTPAFIFPVPTRIAPQRYLVLNSGLTFREGHDRTNSLQNPKLPDWAIIDITQPPDAFSPGRIHDAGFFDEQWRLKGQPKAP